MRACTSEGETGASDRSGRYICEFGVIIVHVLAWLRPTVTHPVQQIKGRVPKGCLIICTRPGGRYNMLLNLTDEVSASPSMNLTAPHWDRTIRQRHV